MTCLKCGETNTHAQMCQAGISLQIAHDLIGERDDWRARAEKAEADRDEARDWVRRLTAAERTLTCVYCGHAYPPGSPTHGAEVLTEHIKECKMHPVHVLTVEKVRIELAVEALHAKLVAAEKRAAELERGLLRYGYHGDACPITSGRASGCTCPGLSALLAPTE